VLLSVGEEKFLHQLYLEEQFGPVTRSNEIDKRKREKGASSGAAIPYSYDDNTSGHGPTEEEEVEGEEEKEDEEEEDDSDIDFGKECVAGCWLTCVCVWKRFIMLVWIYVC
jgi:arginine/serine-rich splicing factor 16